MNTTDLNFQLLDSVLCTVRLGLVVIGADRRILLWNDWMEEAAGIGRDLALGATVDSLFPELAGSRILQAIDSALHGGYPSVLSATLNRAPFPLFYRAPDGRPLTRIEQAIQVMPLSAQLQQRHCLVQINDVTAATIREQTMRQQALALRETQQRQAALLDSIPDIAFLKDAQGRFVAVNQSFRAATGDAGVGKTVFDLYPFDQAEYYHQIDQDVMQSGELRRYDDEMSVYQGGKAWVETIKVPIQDDTGQVIGLAGISRDITARKETETRIHYLAHFDALTRLPNRVLLQDRLALSFAGARRNGQQVALLFLDIDRFKVINDSLGHAVGDQLLRAVAGRLLQCVREVDTVSRLGGDEFVVAIHDVERPADAIPVAQKIIAAISKPVQLEGLVLNTTTSIGISFYPQDGDCFEAVLKNADTALYQVKENGRNGYEFFTRGMRAEAEERLRLESGLRHALERQELSLDFQGQYDLADGRLVGCEAQLRWRHPEMGLVPPARFIPVAEESGLIGPIGEWVLRTACAQNRAWQEADLPAIPIAVNLSSVQLRQKAFVSSLARILAETGLAPEYLELEITESVIMHDAESTIDMLNALKAMGLRLSIDDFGTGYSSLSYLKRFPIDRLKIDQSFVRDITTDPDDAAITGTIIVMAKNLKLKVVAEGVETQAQLDLLRRQGCDEVQGFFIGRPVNRQAFMGELQRLSAVGDRPC